MTVQPEQQLKRQQFYFEQNVFGELNTLQTDIQNAVERMQNRLTGYGILTPVTPAVDSPVSNNVSIGSGFGISFAGKWLSWDNNVTVDTSVATAGNSQGNTAVLTSGNIRFVVIAVRWNLEQSNQVVDGNGANVFTNLEDGYTFDVYMTDEQVAGTDWRGLAAVTSLINSMRSADDAEPVAIAELAFGSNVVAADKLWSLQRVLWEQGSEFDENRLLRKASAYTMVRPVVLNPTGVVAFTAVAQPGLPGQILITGGEEFLIGFKDTTDNNEIRIKRVTVPAATLNMTAVSTKYIIRFRLDVNGTPEIYFGEGDYPLDTALGQDGTGTQGGTSQGFPATLVDAPLLEVDTGIAGSTPTVAQISNTSQTFDRQILVGDVTIQGNLTVTGSVTVTGNYAQTGREIAIGDDDIATENGLIRFLRNATDDPRLELIRDNLSRYFLRTQSGSTPGIATTGLMTGQIHLPFGNTPIKVQDPTALTNETPDTTNERMEIGIQFPNLNLTAFTSIEAEIIFNMSGTPNTGSDTVLITAGGFNPRLEAKDVGDANWTEDFGQAIFQDMVPIAVAKVIDGSPPTKDRGFGIDFTTSTRGATGVYTLIIAGAASIPANDLIAFVTPDPTTAVRVSATVDYGTDQVVVRLYDAADAAVNGAFTIAIFRVAS